MIVPALLTDRKDQLTKMASLCSTFTDFVQIDLMDGVFVPSKSVTSADLKGWRSPTPCEAHLMVADPLSWLDPVCAVGIERFIYHFEIDKDHGEIISRIRQRGVKPGIGVNPETPLSAFESLLDRIDVVLFLSVNPGFYGAAFIPAVLDKMKRFKETHPDKTVGIDGGIKLDNVLQARDAGADYVCVGSAILKAPDPAAAYRSFLERFKAK